MIHSAEVFLWGTRIGIVYQGENDIVVDFEYDRHFIDSGIELSPFQMPLSERVYRFPELGKLQAFRGLPGLLADSLPDRFGNAVINKWLVDRGRSPESFTAIERLCYTGSRGMGALEYVPANGPESRNTNIDVTEAEKSGIREKRAIEIEQAIRGNGLAEVINPGIPYSSCQPGSILQNIKAFLAVVYNENRERFQYSDEISTGTSIIIEK